MELYSRIKMINDNYIDDGIKKDDIGYILNIYNQDYCEVEFSDKNGITYALQSINKKDFIVVED